MAKEPETDETTTYLLRGVPVELWRRVKGKAALNGESLRDVLLRLLREYVKTR